jgi:hypothetical protein
VHTSSGIPTRTIASTTSPAGASTTARTTAPTSPSATTTASPAARLGAAAAPTDEGVIAHRFLRAIVEADEAVLLAMLDPDVWLRAMLVREVIEEHDAVATLARFHGWIGSAVARQVLHATTSSVASRHHLAYRFLLRPAWAPDVWHLIEQSGYVRIREDRISRLDLVCTGFHPQP